MRNEMKMGNGNGKLYEKQTRDNLGLVESLFTNIARLEAQYDGNLVHELRTKEHS